MMFNHFNWRIQTMKLFKGLDMTFKGHSRSLAMSSVIRSAWTLYEIYISKTGKPGYINFKAKSLK